MAKTVCVTGAGGFIASWIVLKLLQRGYRVNGTVRDPDHDQKYGHLKSLEGAKERLTLFKADVLEYDSLVPAIRGCVAVFHTACPVAPKFEKPEDVLVPAVKGTENVMKACYKENIKRVIYTSSGAAVAYKPKIPEDQLIDENCWTDVESCKQDELWYMMAKTEAEKLAWDLANEYDLKLTSFCPVLVLGPLLQPTVNASILVLLQLIDGTKSEYPNYYYSIVDVRDVAEAHVVAFEKDATGRYICSERTVSCGDILESLKKLYPQLPYADKCVGEKTEGTKPSRIANQKVLSLVKEFTPYEKTLADTAASLHEKGLISL